VLFQSKYLFSVSAIGIGNRSYWESSREF